MAYVHIDASEVLEDLSDDDLIKELKRRHGDKYRVDPNPLLVEIERLLGPDLPEEVDALFKRARSGLDRLVRDLRQEQDLRRSRAIAAYRQLVGHDPSGVRYDA